ncbi:MAG: hypothetical protein P1V51_08665 [Deltaproteobacteria bacterium]|nr:hypothetical protein [Deltaproteobacteria bacterium]
MTRLLRAEFLFAIAASTVLALAGGCGSENVVPAPYSELHGGGEGTNLDPVDGPVWKIVATHEGVFEAEAGSHVQVPFQVLRDDEPMAAEVVRFELRTVTGEAQLTAEFDLTRENGLAAAELDAGPGLGEVIVVAVHSLGGEAEFPLTIIEPAVVEPLPATLRVGVLYASQARWPVDEVSVTVAEGIDCAGIEAGQSFAPLGDQLLPDLQSSLLFTRVKTEVPLTVVAVGTQTGAEMASGCVDGLVLAPEENGGVVVRLLPFGLDATGTWAVSHSFDFGNALPGDLGGVFSVLDQLFDDPDDPARYLVGWIQTELGFSLGPIEEMVISLVDDLLVDVIPAGLQGLFQRVGEAARLVTQFGVDATMVIAQDPTSATGQLQSDELWHAARFVWKGQPHTVDLAAAGLPETRALYPVQVAEDARLIVPSHDLEIPFVGLYRVVLTNLVYPDIAGNGATTTHDLLRSVIDCQAVASEIEASDGAADGQLDLGLVQIPASQLEASCDAGLGYIANQIDGQIDGLAGSGPSILTLDGIADLDGDDGQRHPLHMDAGQWTGHLDLSGNQHVVSGTFDGTRQ